MLVDAVFIQEIVQIDDYHFEILWTDGKRQSFRLSDLQKNCPCARCVNEETGERLVNLESIDERVRARKIQSVGRYALRIDYTSACSLGIYAFSRLRELGNFLEE